MVLHAQLLVWGVCFELVCFTVTLLSLTDVTPHLYGTSQSSGSCFIYETAMRYLGMELFRLWLPDQQCRFGESAQCLLTKYWDSTGLFFSFITFTDDALRKTGNAYCRVWSKAVGLFILICSNEVVILARVRIIKVGGCWNETSLSGAASKLDTTKRHATEEPRHDSTASKEHVTKQHAQKSTALKAHASEQHSDRTAQRQYSRATEEHVFM